MKLLDMFHKKNTPLLLTSGYNGGKITTVSPLEIKLMRVSLGWSQQKFGSELGVGITTVLRWEKGYAKPSPLAIEKLKWLKKRKEQGEI